MTPSPTPAPACRICQTPSRPFFQDVRAFFKCPECFLIFTLDLPDKELEENHYKAQWETAQADFWKSQVDGLLSYIQAYRVPERILDFGSGSGEMARELRGRGFNVTELEPMRDGYLKDQSYPVLFDAVVGVEVIEHLPNPWEELREIEKVLAPEGIVLFSTMMTNPFVEAPNAAEHFKTWWYKDDPTHVSFYCNRALSKMADLGGYDIDIIADKVFVIRKEARPT